VADIDSALDAMRRIVRALRIAAQRTNDRSGISAAQLYVLQTLEASPAQSLSELAERTLTDRSSVADVVERLAERGLVERALDDRDRRRVSIALTGAGRRVLRNAPPPPTSILVEALESLNDSDLSHLARGLSALTSRMGVAGEPARMLFEDE
jgi:DNA-binding MarR family transcriptional regulator